MSHSLKNSSNHTSSQSTQVSGEKSLKQNLSQVPDGVMKALAERDADHEKPDILAFLLGEFNEREKLQKKKISKQAVTSNKPEESGKKHVKSIKKQVKSDMMAKSSSVRHSEGTETSSQNVHFNF